MKSIKYFYSEISINKISGVWNNIQGTNFTIRIDKSMPFLITYKLDLIAINDFQMQSPMPSEKSKEYLLIRCLINQNPSQISSSMVTSYFVSVNNIFSVEKSFPVTMPQGYSQIILQWKKVKESSQSTWYLRNVYNSGSSYGRSFSISAIADFKEIHYLKEKKDFYLTDDEIWKDLTSTLEFNVFLKGTVYIGYSINVEPQLAAIIKGESREYISSRIILDNIPFKDGSAIFG